MICLLKFIILYEFTRKRKEEGNFFEWNSLCSKKKNLWREKAKAQRCNRVAKWGNDQGSWGRSLKNVWKQYGLTEEYDSNCGKIWEIIRTVLRVLWEYGGGIDHFWDDAKKKANGRNSKRNWRRAETFGRNRWK